MGGRLKLLRGARPPPGLRLTATRRTAHLTRRRVSICRLSALLAPNQIRRKGQPPIKLEFKPTDTLAAVVRWPRLSHACLQVDAFLTPRAAPTV